MYAVEPAHISCVTPERQFCAGINATHPQDGMLKRNQSQAFTECCVTFLCEHTKCKICKKLPTVKLTEPG